MSNVNGQHGGTEHVRRTFVAHTIRRLSVPIIIGWLVLIALLSIKIPALEVIGKERSVSMSPKDAPSMQAMMRMGKVFGESDSDSIAMIVLEGDQPLGDAAHEYYDALIKKLEADTTHVQHVQDFWGDPLTAAGAQSSDGKAAYVQLNLAGNQGQALANESVEAVEDAVDSTPPPPGV
jgi:RND superfamily putative drug exporter